MKTSWYSAAMHSIPNGLKFIGISVLLLASFSFFVANAAPAPKKPAALKPVAAESSKVPGRYIVQFKDDVSDVPGLAKKLSQDMGGTLGFTYTRALRGFSAQLSEAAAEALSHNPNVASVTQDQTVGLAAPQHIPEWWYWGLDRVDQRAMPLDWFYRYYGDGAGVHIYIVDSGIRATHQDFGSRVGEGMTVISDSYGQGDCLGHGTAVASIAAGSSWGVAKAATLHPVRVFGCTDSTTWEYVIAGLDWVAQNHVSPAVANLSLGGGYYAPANTAVENLVASGVTVVAAAGNNSTDACTISPASAATAITVGASEPEFPATSPEDADYRADYSNYGPCLDLFAPGSSVGSAWIGSDQDFNVLSGTSLASPFVAGAAALYLADHPSASASEVASALVAHATPDTLLAPTLMGSPNLLLYTRNFGSTPSPDPEAPSTPAAFTAQAPGPGMVTLSWQASADNVGVAGYYIYRDNVLIAETQGLSYTDQLQLPGTFTYQVRAYDTEANFSEPAVASVTTPPDTEPPTVPTNFGFEVIDSNYIALWWNDSIDNVALGGYRVYRDGAFMASTSMAYIEDNQGIVSGQTYVYTVEATDTSGNVSPQSEPVIITVPVVPDTSAPTASIASPQSGAVLRGTVTVTANASDNIGVARVEFYKDGTLMATASSSPYMAVWNTLAESDGTHTLQTIAYDMTGNAGTSTVISVTVDNSLPVTAITSPSNNATIAKIVAVNATASDALGVVRVEFWKDSLLFAFDTAAPYSFSWNTHAETNTSHSLMSKAYDAAGNVGTSSVVTVVVDNAAPVVVITSPANGAKIKGNVTISATASDASGISSIVLRADGATLTTCFGTTSCSYTWPSKNITSGSHTISATATDTLGNSAVTTITVIK